MEREVWPTSPTRDADALPAATRPMECQRSNDRILHAYKINLANCICKWQFSRMIARTCLEAELERSLTDHPVTTLLGPRQCGKTTLARGVAGRLGATMFDLQDPEIRAAFANPKFVLSPLSGLVVLDEAQLVPELYPVLRILVDEDRRLGRDRRFLLLGSAAPQLIKGIS